MIIGVPKEIKEQEYRVALLPSGAYQLIKRGHEVLVERGAGLGAGYPDAEYEQAGAKLINSHAATLFERCRRLSSSKSRNRSPRNSACCAGPDSVSPIFTSRRIARSLPSADEIQCDRAGLRNRGGQSPTALTRTDERNRRAHVYILVGGYFPAKTFWRQRRLCSAACRACCREKSSCWAVARRASMHARMAQGLGADVAPSSKVDPFERMRFLRDITLHTAHTLYSNESCTCWICCPNVDVCLSAPCSCRGRNWRPEN